VFVERPNRFLVTARLRHGDDVVEAHLADPGRLRELLTPGCEIWLRPAHGGARKTRWSAALVRDPGGRGLVSIDSTLPNRLVRSALQSGQLEELKRWRYERSEAAIGASRIDFLLTDGGRRTLALEVKSATLVEDGQALFPDAVTERGARHVAELTRLATAEADEWAAAILFVVQREDVSSLRAAREIDEVFADRLDLARASGVQVFARRCSVSTSKVALGPSVPVV
jgi:sugar fermentation stimulation protein A